MATARRPAEDLVAGLGGILSETGTDLTVFSDPLQNGSDTTTTYFSLGLTDAVAGGALKTIAIGNPSPQEFISGKTSSTRRPSTATTASSRSAFPSLGPSPRAG